MDFLKTAAIFFMVGLTMIILVPAGVILFILSVLGFRRSMAFLVYKIGQGWSRLMIFLTGCTLTVIGRENIPVKEGVCFVSNHGSIFDIVLLLASTGRPIGFVAKKELALIPFLNIWILLIGGLFIDRKNIRKAVNTIGTGVKRIKAGGGMIIFPEGHRNRGRGLLPFHPGSFKLATQSEAPIVPVAITGSYEVFEKTHRVHALPVRVVFCEPIITADIPPGDRRAALAERARGVIAAALGPAAAQIEPGMV
jgi:1-acyl-sn-glycerol-3-phosphate acyltransferase